MAAEPALSGKTLAAMGLKDAILRLAEDNNRINELSELHCCLKALQT